MLIESVLIKNYRSLLDEEVYLEDLTALVGANGTGKSTFLKALEIFYAFSQSIKQDDYYNKDTSSPIVVAVTYKKLSEEAKRLFGSYLQDDKLTIELVIDWTDGKPSFKYHGASLQNPDFASVRNASSARDKKEKYVELKKNEKYQRLPDWKNQTTVIELDKWENENRTQCVRMRDDGQFFGFKSVAKGYLGKFSQFLFIPAVRNAGIDIEDGKSSTFSRLMDLVVRSVLVRKEEYVKLKNKTEEKYKEIMDPEKLTELKVLEKQMTETMKIYVPNAQVGLNWLPLAGITMPMPQADIKLIEDGFESSVEKTGHGLQRAFILTLLQHLAMEQVKSAKTDEGVTETDLPTLILAIEEPEIYQHPNRQRHLAKILRQLADGKMPGVADNTQIIYCTHSPHFVGIDRIDQIRLFRKLVNEVEKPKITKVIHTTLDEVALASWEADGKRGQQYTGASLIPRLHAIMTPWMNEGFFADANILVEGEDDRAAILGTAKAMGHELEGDGFSIIPCGGKTNIDRPYIIFTKLGIPTYIVWDGDYGKGETSGACELCGKADGKANPDENKKLLRLVGSIEEEWPAYIEDKFSCFKDKLESTLCEEIGTVEFERILVECQKKYGVTKKKHAIKNPNIVTDIITSAKAAGESSASLEKVVNRILSLKKEAITSKG
ncbi:MAG: ATP-dependent endonuclease [Candidatus Moraniibacteriota bacterium]